MTQRPFEQTVDVETPELVRLTYSLAGIGSRALAAVTDLAICLGLFLALTVAAVMLGSDQGVAGSPDMSTSVAFAILGLLYFVIIWGYYVLCEALMDGQTFGKRIHRLRVVREGGYSVTLGVAATRNLVRIIDMQPGIFYLVGLASVFFSKRSRRVGDFIAGTIVVREELRELAPVFARKSQANARALQTLLDEEQFAVLARFVERWSTIDPVHRTAIAGQLAARFGAALEEGDKPVGQKLLELHQREQLARQQGVAGKGETGAARHLQVLIARQQKSWTDFASTLALVQKQGLNSLEESGVARFVADYRSLSQDLAQLQTASSRRVIDETFYLGRIVAGAHNVLYRNRGLGLAGGVRYLFTDVPNEIRRSAAPIALAGLLLFGPAVISGVGIATTPSLASSLLPASMIQRADDGVRRAREGEGYIDDPQLLRPVMASSIMRNNVQVTFAAFAGGATAGILTAFLLVFNGISMGSVVGLYASKGIWKLLLAFVAPHGVLELFAICVAGGGGFLIAQALLLPGERSRRTALVENSRRAIRLIAASTFLLVIAGTLEGFVSPIEWWPLEGKLAVSGLTLLFLVSYLRGGTGIRQIAARDLSSRY